MIPSDTIDFHDTGKAKNKMRNMTKVLAGLLLALFLGAYWFVAFDESRDVSALFPEPFIVISHRGETGQAPENTMAAFRIATQERFPIELDTLGKPQK
ncbi:MAG: hypothetical protein ACI9BD_000178 [Candidatus Marinamargulisbacteria bacterium]|jgi:hypothetical protein